MAMAWAEYVPFVLWVRGRLWLFVFSCSCWLGLAGSGYFKVVVLAIPLCSSGLVSRHLVLVLVQYVDRMK